jgi:hypothetical protein
MRPEPQVSALGWVDMLLFRELFRVAVHLAENGSLFSQTDASTAFLGTR